MHSFILARHYFFLARLGRLSRALSSWWGLWSFGMIGRECLLRRLLVLSDVVSNSMLGPSIRRVMLLRIAHTRWWSNYRYVLLRRIVIHSAHSTVFFRVSDKILRLVLRQAHISNRPPFLKKMVHLSHRFLELRGTVLMTFIEPIRELSLRGSRRQRNLTIRLLQSMIRFFVFFV